MSASEGRPLASNSTHNSFNGLSEHDVEMFQSDPDLTGDFGDIITDHHASTASSEVLSDIEGTSPEHDAPFVEDTTPDSVVHPHGDASPANVRLDDDTYTGNDASDDVDDSPRPKKKGNAAPQSNSKRAPANKKNSRGRVGGTSGVATGKRRGARASPSDASNALSREDEVAKASNPGSVAGKRKRQYVAIFFLYKRPLSFLSQAFRESEGLGLVLFYEATLTSTVNSYRPIIERRTLEGPPSPRHPPFLRVHRWVVSPVFLKPPSHPPFLFIPFDGFNLRFNLVIIFLCFVPLPPSRLLVVGLNRLFKPFPFLR